MKRQLPLTAGRTSVSSDPPRPPVYTPFLRRFTDEPARDLSETIALYEDVRQAHENSVFAAHDVVSRVNAHCADIVGQLVSLPNNLALGEALDRCQSSPRRDFHRARIRLLADRTDRRFPPAQTHSKNRQSAHRSAARDCQDYRHSTDGRLGRRLNRSRSKFHRRQRR